MTYLRSALLIIIMFVATTAHAETNSVQIDLITARIVSAIKAEKFSEALPLLAQLEELETPPSEDFHYLYIDTLDRAGDVPIALSRSYAYLEKYGRPGKYYSRVIEITSRLQDIADRDAKKAAEDKIRREREEREIRIKMEQEERERLYKTGEIGIRPNSSAEVILRKMKELEKNNFSEYKRDSSRFKSMVREYESLWSEYFHEFVVPARPILAQRSESGNDLKMFIDFSHKYAGMTASEIDAEIRILNHQVGVLYMRPNSALAGLYDGMEKVSMADEAENIEGMRIASWCWSRVYVEADEDRRGAKFTVDQCVRKYDVSMEKWRARIAKW